MTARQPRQQLAKGMEHLRFAVTMPDSPANDGLPQHETTSEEAAYGVPSYYQPVRKPQTDASANPNKRTDPFQFGSRFLEEGDDIFAYNAWDHVEVDATYAEFIETQTALQRESPVSEFDKKRFNDHPERWWDKFYSNNKDNFFKDRKWLGQEFPLLKDVTKKDAGPCTILEVGAGAGNTAFPIVTMNENEDLRMHACDYSKKAVEVMRSSELYNEKVMTADVWDIAGDVLPPGLAEGSVDVLIMIFIFSALEPAQWIQALKNIWTLLKPGGSILFRDYGRGDLAQVRFKKGRYLDENFYIRGDGTRVYFFEQEELRRIWSEAGFDIENLGTDRRMLVNRQRRLKMYRCWMQGFFKRPAESTA